MLTRRLQVLLDDDRYERISRAAARRKVSVAVVVREAIDAAFPADDRARAAAARAILEAAPMPVDEPADLRAELDEIRAGEH